VARLLILDSGVGGLSVYHEIHTRLPALKIDYALDNAAYPYGNKDETWLSKRVVSWCRQLIQRYQPDIIVLACNTASTATLPALRAATDIPIVGVVPAIKTAAQVSPSKNIGLLATPGTVSRRYTQELIHDFAHDCQVTKVGAHHLVHIAEDKLQGIAVDMDLLATEIAPLLNAQVDTVVLGCTHYPLLKSELSELAPHIRWVDSGEAIARRVESLLQQHAAQENTRDTALSSTAQITPALHTYLENLGFTHFDLINVPD
jgi:glutamate racemase